MKVKAPGATTQRKKAPAAHQGPTDAQTRALDALMREAQKPGELWKWGLTPYFVCCERWAGTKLRARHTYEYPEIARLGDEWPSHVMAALGDPWNASVMEGIK